MTDEKPPEQPLPDPKEKPGEGPVGQAPFGAGPHGPQAAGGPAGTEHNPDPPRPKQEDGIVPPDTKRGWKGDK